MTPTFLLTALVFLPALGAIIVALLPKNDEVVRYVTLIVTIITFLLSVILWARFDYTTEAAAHMQQVFNIAWIPSFDIDYFMGTDGISFPLVMLTTFVSVLAMGASWSITKYIKGYCILFLLLETGMIGVFLSLDFFLFYVFWEVMLLPMYFLIGVWGGPRREYAAIKFFLYTLVGSVLMLIAILMLYFHSDVRELAKVYKPGSEEWTRLNLNDSVKAKVAGEFHFAAAEGSGTKFVVNKDVNAEGTTAAYDATTNTVTVTTRPSGVKATDVIAAVEANPFIDSSVGTVGFGPEDPVHTFNLQALAAMGQKTKVFNESVQWWAFLLLFIGFAIKVPAVPVHTWLPDAHVEAPTPISMILAGVLLKMGGYGIIRICYPICPYGGYQLMYFVCTIGVVSMVYGAFAAMAQKDFKRLVAYSSVSHMGYVTLGLGVWSASMHAGGYDPWYWNMGVKGAMFQMIGHGISSTGMFFMVGVVYDRVHHRNLNEFGDLFKRMPVYTALAIGIFFAGLGLPGLCGFIGEALVVLSVWKFDPILAIISAAVVILTAAYILWAIQRVFLGHEYKGPHAEALVPANGREKTIAAILFVFAILFGVLPHQAALQYMDKTIDRQVQDLSDWTRRHESAEADGGSWAEVMKRADLVTADDPPANKQQFVSTESNVAPKVRNKENIADNRQDSGNGL